MGFENPLWVNVEARQSGVGGDLACIRRRPQCVRIHCYSVDQRFVASGRSPSCNTRAKSRVRIEERVRITWSGRTMTLS